MELITWTKDGVRLRLTVERDKHSVHQVFAWVAFPGEPTQGKYLCHGWGVRKAGGGFVEGILTSAGVIRAEKADWMRILACREDLRDKDNLADIHLVRIFFRGDQLSADGYTLSARVDRETWAKIEPYMTKVDSAVNETLYEGDRFVGWMVKAGYEEAVESILDVKPQNRIHARQERP